jgi:hypothetical protein
MIIKINKPSIITGTPMENELYIFFNYTRFIMKYAGTLIIRGGHLYLEL